MKIIEVVADKGHADTIIGIAKQQEAEDCWLGPVGEDGRQTVHILVKPEPSATLGLMLGSGQYGLATGAGLLLAVNIVCVNLAAKLVFLIKGVCPRTWLEKQKARQSMATYIVIWFVSLLILVVAIYIRQ